MGLQSSSSPPLKPYLSNLTQAKGWTEVVGPSSMQKRKEPGAEEKALGPDCPEAPLGNGPTGCFLNTLPWRLNDFLFLLALLHLLNRRCSRSP